MKPSTRRTLTIALGGLLIVGFLVTLLKGDTHGARDIANAIVGFAIFGGLAWVGWTIRTRPRRQAAQDAAQAFGLRFSPTDPFHLLDLPLPLLHRAASVRGLENVMFGRWHQMEVRLFEYWFARSTNPSLNDFERFSFVVTPLPAWWPDLVIVPETLVSRAIGHATMREVGFESEAFNRAFTVRSADPRFASALLDARMMQWLLDRSGPWGFEIAGGVLLCYRSPQLQPWELLPVLEAASEFMDMVPDVVSDLFDDRPDLGSSLELE
jgi:hypothetical protein